MPTTAKTPTTSSAKKSTSTKKSSTTQQKTEPTTEPAPAKDVPADREVDPAAVAALDVDDITHCPLGEQCWTCETTEQLAIATVDTSVGGVFCATLCVDCYDGDVPDCSVIEATKRVVAHAAHLGTTVDVMYAKQRVEDEEIAQLQAAQQLDDTTS